MRGTRITDLFVLMLTKPQMFTPKIVEFDKAASPGAVTLEANKLSGPDVEFGKAHAFKRGTARG